MKLKKFNNIFLIKIIACFSLISLFSVGFASFLIENVSFSSSLNGSFNVQDITKENDYVTLKISKRFDKNEFLKNVDTSRKDSSKIDKLIASLNWENNGSNSNYLGDLRDYFYLYDAKNPFSESGPYIRVLNNNETLYFENHSYNEELKKLDSSLYYSNSYDLIDTNNTVFDTNEINRQMEIIACLLDPSNGNEVKYGEVTRNDSFNYIKIYYTEVPRVDNNSNITSYEYRFHIFYHYFDSSEIYRYDVNYNNSTSNLYTSTTSLVPSVTVNNFSKTDSLNSTKDSTTTITYTSNFNSNNTTIALNSSRNNNNGGYDAQLTNIDLNKTKDDFASYDERIRNYISSISTNIVSGTTLEIISETDEGSNISNPLSFVKAYESRLKTINSSRIDRYGVYILFFDKVSGELILLTNTNRYYSGTSYTDTNWPKLNIFSNNTYGFKDDKGNARTGGSYSSSIVPDSKYSRQYIRFYMTHSQNSAIQNQVYYIFNQYYENIDTNATFDYFTKKNLIDYMLLVNNNVKNPPSGGKAEYKDLNIDIAYPYLYGFMTRYRTSDNKYYNYRANIFYYYTGDNASSNNQIRLLQLNYSVVDASNESITIDEWPTFTINELYISNRYHDEASYINYTFDFENESINKNSETRTSNFGSVTGNLDLNFIEDEIVRNETKYRNINSLVNSYSIQTPIDFNRNYGLNYSINDNGNYNFVSYYSLINNSGTSKYSNTYTFGPNLYGFYYGIGTGVNTDSAIYNVTNLENNPNTYNYLSNDFYLNDSYIDILSQKDNKMFTYVFKNDSTNETRKFVIGINNTKTKTQLFRTFDSINSNFIDIEYNIKLKVKENYKGLASELIKSFDFNLDLGMKEFEV